LPPPPKKKVKTEDTNIIINISTCYAFVVRN
jgi:hypothetical protein